MMYLLRFVLDKINTDYAMTFPPIDLVQVRRFSIVMKKAGFEVIPNDYALFLGWTDGLMWNGLELFSIYPHDRPDTIYPQPTLLEYQKTEALKQAFPHKLILGRYSEELLCYDGNKKEYQILDRFTYQLVLSFPRFVDMLYFYAGCEGLVTLPTETAS